MGKIMDEYKKNQKAIDVLWDEENANFLASKEAVKNCLSTTEREDLAERIQMAQKYCNYLSAAAEAFGLWKLGKGIYKVTRKLKRRR